MEIEIGQSYLFVYPNFGTPNGFPEYSEHSGQIVTVIEQEETESGPLLTVRANDGWIGEVWQEELEPSDKDSQAVKDTEELDKYSK